MGKRAFIIIVLVAFAVCAVAFAQQRKAVDEGRFGSVEVKRTESHIMRPAGVLVIPWHVNYQGYLTDDVGNPINDTLSMRFSIWDAASVGTELWNETQNVIVEDAIFNVILGSITPIPSDVFATGESRWLELTVGIQPLFPRTEITSVAYAYRSVKTDSAEYALDTDMVDGFDASVAPTANDLFPLTYGDAQYVNEGQADAVTSSMVVDGTLLRADVDAAFKAPYADTADYALNAPTDNDWTIAGNDMYSAVVGNVGIGTSPSPAGKLHVSGNCIIDGGAYIGQPDSIESVLDIYNADVSDWELVAAGDADRFDVREWGGSPLLSVEAGGNVGVGTTSPAERLDVTGTVQMTGFSLPTGATSGYVLTADVSGQGTWQAAAADNDWAITGSVLHPSADYGLAMRSSNLLYGDSTHTHVNFGIACTTGVLGLDLLYCTVSGGSGNRARNDGATVGGGENNTARGIQATVGGGQGNTASGNNATVGGGWDNTANQNMATVGGGDGNLAGGNFSTVGGGRDNVARAYATVGGGSNDTASGDHATVGGGGDNMASGDWATVAGGALNTATGIYATVGGGASNSSASYATVSGGVQNTASEWYATVGGGYADTAAGWCSFAAGSQVRIGAAGDYTFAFGRNFTTSTPNAVIFHDSSNEIKVGIGETAPANILTVRQTSATDPIADAWTIYSSKRWKTNIETIPDALEKVQKLRGVYFDWKEDGQHDIGMIAEEVGEVIPEVVAYEPDGDDARSLDYARLVAVLVEAVKAQQDRIEALEAKIENMEP